MESTKKNNALRIVVVDDDEDEFILIRRLLQKIEGYDFHLDWLSNPSDAILTLAANEHDLCFLDYNLGATTGLELLDDLSHTICDTPIIALTGAGAKEVDHAFTEAGAIDYLEKEALTAPQLERTIRYAIARKNSERENKEMALEIEKLRRVESLGILAGGIAHDFNNMLAIVSSHARMLKRRCPTDDKKLSISIRAILSAIDRADELTTLMRACTGKSLGAIHDFDLSQLVAGSKDLLEAIVPENAILETKTSPHRLPMRGDPSMTKMILVNLVTNALEAIEGDGGRILVRAGESTLTEDTLKKATFSSSSHSGRFVFFEVADNGKGIDKEILDKIFDPFFTTKFIGRGLGMAAVRGIVSSHGGAVFIESTQESGTSVRICFPTSRDSILPGPLKPA